MSDVSVPPKDFRGRDEREASAAPSTCVANNYPTARTPTADRKYPDEIALWHNGRASWVPKSTCVHLSDPFNSNPRQLGDGGTPCSAPDAADIPGWLTRGDGSVGGRVGVRAGVRGGGLTGSAISERAGGCSLQCNARGWERALILPNCPLS